MICYCLVAKTLLKVTFSQKVQFVFQISESGQIWSTNHTSWKKATFTTYLVFTFVIDISFQPNQCKGHLNWGGKRIGKNIWTFFYFIFFMYTHYGYIRTMVNVSVLVVLIFSQNFSTNGPYVVLIFCKFSDYMVLIFEKTSHTAVHTMYFR